jgi:ABC-2 type transport system ATP-binding protein
MPSHPLVVFRHIDDEAGTDNVTGDPSRQEKTAMATIETRGLRKTYPGGVEAVKGIDIDVEAGEVFGVLGSNGAGKSTTIGMLTTTVLPSAGSARVAGYDVVSQPLQSRRSSSVVFQGPVVDRTLSGREHLDLHARLWASEPARASRRIEELSRVLGISELLDRSVGTYSGGQRRRLEIARALVSDPQVLFLDEPTVGRDPLIRPELLDVIARLRRREDVTILLTTHYLDEAQRLCDRVAILHEGAIVALDSPDALLSPLGSEILETRVERDPQGALEAVRAHGLAGGDAYVVGTRLTVPLHDGGAGEALRALDGAGLAATDIQVRPPTLDDVYIQLTGAHADAA